MLSSIHTQSYALHIVAEGAAKCLALAAMTAVAIRFLPACSTPKLAIVLAIALAAGICSAKAGKNYEEYNKYKATHPEHAKTCWQRAAGWYVVSTLLKVSAIAVAILMPSP